MAAEDVVNWIAEIKLEEYLPNLIAQGFTTLADFRNLDEGVLDACGIEKPGHRKRILKAVAGLNGHSTRAPPSSGDPLPARPTPKPRPASMRKGVGTGQTPVPPVRRPSRPVGNGAAPNGEVPQESLTPPPLPPKRNRRQSSQTSAAATPPPAPTAPKPRLDDDEGADVPPPVPPKQGAVSSRPTGWDPTNAKPATPALPPTPSIPTSGASGSQTGWDPTNAKAAPPSKLAERMKKKKGPPRPPLPIHRPKRHPTQVAAQPKSIVEIEDDDDEIDYVAMPIPKRMSSLYADGESVRRLETYQGKPTEVSQRTLTGYLYKKGGKTGTKGWDKRWFDLSDGELKYFKDKEKKPNGVIPVNQMIDIRPTTKDTGGKHNHRFEIDTPDRTYYLSAETVSEMTEWMMLLAALIHAKEKNKDESETVGGEMSEPEKAGWILIRGNDLRQKFVRHYLAIKGDVMCFYTSYDDFAKEKPLHKINFLFVNLKTPVSGSKKDRNNQFQILTNGPTFECRAESAGELKSVIGAIQSGIQFAYSQMKSDKTTTTEKIPNAKALEMMRENASNLICADCGASKPDWASINLGIMFCLECCGIHRGLGVHITKCRSAMMDEWNTDLISVLTGIGNRSSNEFWEGTLPDGVKPIATSTKEDRAEYIRRKYVDKEFVRFRKEPSEYTVSSMKSNLSSDDLLLTLEHILAGIGPAHPGANAILSEATRLQASAQVELLKQNRFELSADVSDEREREAFELQAVDGNWHPVWIDYKGGSLNLFSDSEVDSPDESVPAGAFKSVVDNGTHIELALTAPVASGSTCLALRPLSQSNVGPWASFLFAVISELPSTATRFDFATCTKTGMLSQIGSGGVPQKPRVFAVRGESLRFFSSWEDPQELGCIDCRSLRSIVPGVVPGSLGADASFSSEGSFSLVSEDAVFVLDATTATEMLSWVHALRNTQVFGASIDSHTTTVPFVVDRCCTFLESQEGEFDQLYAQPGDRHRIDELKTAFNRDGDSCNLLAVGGYSAHDVANLLQLFFMELPVPLLPASIFTDLSEVHDLDFDALDSIEIPPALSDTLSQLPACNRDTLGRMCQHVHYITELCPFHAGGASTLDRLACVFGPLLFGLDETDEANEVAVSFANYSVKLLLTHPALTFSD